MMPKFINPLTASRMIFSLIRPLFWAINKPFITSYSRREGARISSSQTPPPFLLYYLGVAILGAKSRCLQGSKLWKTRVILLILKKISGPVPFFSFFYVSSSLNNWEVSLFSIPTPETAFPRKLASRPGINPMK